jgi:hypothetical protein
VKALYSTSNKALWTANDFFMTARILELERKGLPTRNAIYEAGKHITNYRIPSDILGSRQAAQALKLSGNFVLFNPYHYDVLKSYGHMLNDAFGKTDLGRKLTLKDRVDAIGHMFALGVLMFGIYPLFNQALQQVTGNKNAEFAPRGPTSIPLSLLKWGKGDMDFAQVLAHILQFAPLLKEPIEQATNLDWFTHKRVQTQPGMLGAAERVQHAGAGFLSPFGTMARAFKQGSLSPILQEMFGYKDPTAQQLGGRAYGKQQEERERQKGLKGIRAGRAGPIPYWADILMQR